MALTAPLQNSLQEPYRDSPIPSPVSSPPPSGRASPAKPLPSLPNEARGPPPQYRDDASTESSVPEVIAPRPQRYRAPSAHVERQVYFPPYSDAIPEVNDDDVPLAHLYPYPTEAPPSYATVIVQSYRDTLVSHIPSHSTVYVSDEELGVERAAPDDVRFPIERVVAKLVVGLLFFSGFLVWHLLRVKGIL
ncbi:hypothetical protein BDV96DRAFT_486363 [Lophiotrema nucula]|uniref:Uncharacterized protein n=1 Tax=Lophiotrema nucula TaxID=690887 RepID=A0A6A5ZJQ8_9PLEO|nr:hypothetical protein BDV96DRAFT_486363 [Lophiotrema nucula]